MTDQELMAKAEESVLTCTVATEPKAQSVDRREGWAFVRVHGKTLQEPERKYDVTIHLSTGKVTGVDRALRQS